MAVVSLLFTVRKQSENIIALTSELQRKKNCQFSFTFLHTNFPSQFACRVVSRFNIGCRIVGEGNDRTTGSQAGTFGMPSPTSPIPVCKTVGRRWGGRPPCFKVVRDGLSHAPPPLPLAPVPLNHRLRLVAGNTLLCRETRA